jgi:hypothetical protein
LNVLLRLYSDNICRVTGLSAFLQDIWFASGVLQIAILALIVARRHYRPLPMFSLYIGLNLAQAVILFYVYGHFGFASVTSFQIYWATQVLAMIAQTLASTELLHRALQDYPGIWELSWRIISFAILVVIGYAWATANRNDKWGLLHAVRGFYLTFAVAFIACLLLIRHYSIAIDQVYRSLIGGFCFYACGSFVADTLLKHQAMNSFPKYAEVWNSAELLIFFVVLIAWSAALWHPVRVPAQGPGPGNVNYETFSPQVNARLREMNDSLRKFFGRRASES